jgi:hypothetical protein
MMMAIIMSLSAEAKDFEDELIPALETGNLIENISYDPVLHQFEVIKIEIDLNDSIEFNNMSFAVNFDSRIGGTPPVTHQLPFTKISWMTDFMNNSKVIAIRAPLSDQNIFFDGKGMLDNITITLAFLCIHEGFEEVEKISLLIKDVNEPPEIRGGIAIEPEEVVAGERVTISTGTANDPEGKEVFYRWKIGDDGVDSGRSFSWTFTESGIHSLELVVHDGSLNETESSTVLVRPESVLDESLEAGNNSTPNERNADEPESKLPWFLVPILLIMILFVMILGIIRSVMFAEDPPEKRDPPRRLWSMSPLKGPSGYERSTLSKRLEYLGHPGRKDLDDEEVLNEDLRRWEKDWDFKPGF